MDASTDPITSEPGGSPLFLPAPTDEELARLPRELAEELRSDHAGETGAVFIYRGILAVTRDAGVRDFAREHLATEARHLLWFEKSLPKAMKTRLTRACAAVGWLTGALPALFGPRAVFATIEAVETFVDDHYQAQIDALVHLDQPLLVRALRAFQDDEVAHRDDATSRVADRPGGLLGAWTRLVGAGSRLGVVIARRI